ncbi:MAG TPA: ABC transporter permease [Acidimicrobiaceae bacterium]|nr:ABC transporter permease [Acidimicrobiaceae bacterium]
MWVPPLVAFAVLAGAWQLYAVHNPTVIPKIQQVVSQLVDRPYFFFRNALTTIQEAVVGAAFGMGMAFLLAVLMSFVRIVERAVLPLAVILNVTPVIAVAPALVVAFGFGMTPKYVITAVVVFFPFLINALIGLRSIDPLSLDVLTTLHASRTEVLWRLRLPSSLPFLFAAARICMPLSVIGAVVAEFVAAGRTNGLGTLIVTAASLGDLKTIYAAVAVLAVTGIVFFLVVVILQAKLLTWHSSAATAANA